MAIELFLQAIPTWLLLLLIPLIIWEVIWKGIGLWKAGRNNQPVWFVFILLLNTAGILPIIYLLFFTGSVHSQPSAFWHRAEWTQSE